MKLRLTAALCVVLGSAQAEPISPFLQAGGTWHGVGIQTGDIHWPIEVTLSAESSTLSYPSFGCLGEWLPLKIADDDLLAIENITDGKETCSDGGVVRVTALDAEMLSYVWFDSEGKPTSRAVLIPGPFREDRYEPLLRLTMETLDMSFLSRDETPSAPTDL